MLTDRSLIDEKEIKMKHEIVMEGQTFKSSDCGSDCVSREREQKDT